MSAVANALSAFTALVEVLVAGKDAKIVAQQRNVPFEELVGVFAKVRPNTWQGRLARASANPHQRCDLFNQVTRLAALEHQYSVVMSQLHRAEEVCSEVRNLEKRDIKVIMKADAFCFRIQQAASRLLRDMEKAEIRFEKSVISPTIPLPILEQSASEERKSPEQTLPIAQPSLSNSSVNPATDSDNTPLDNAPMPEEFSEVLIKNRHRIKNTRPKDRPALIERLIREQRAKQPAAAAA